MNIILSILGLIIDLIGVLLLFRFGILPDNLWQHILLDSRIKDKDEKRHKLWSKIAVSCLIIGFSFQLSGSITQVFMSDSIKVTTAIEKPEIKNLPDDKNQYTGATGKLKLKYFKGKLSYQLEVNLELEKIGNLDEFEIEFQDADGFEISTLCLNIENEFSNYTDDGILTLSSKGSVNYKNENFKQINSWELKTRQKGN